MQIRHPDPTRDFDEVLALMQAYDRSVYGDTDWTAAELDEDWRRIDLAQDAWLATAGGRIAGVMHLYDVRGGRVLVDGYVHPELTGRGAGTRLLETAEARAVELGASLPPGETLHVESGHLVGDPRAPGLFACRGYTRVRTFHRMVIDLAPSLAEPAWPQGVELRPFAVERDARRVQEAVDEAFADEWGYEPRPFDVWRQRVLEVGSFDPDLFLLAWEGDELVAVSLNYPKRLGDWGWIGTLAVRPAWRRRGLGLALLREGFRRFAARGETVAALGVDSENPTGATRLYERAGMRVLWRADVWRKELRR